MVAVTLLALIPALALGVVPVLVGVVAHERGQRERA